MAQTLRRPSETDPWVVKQSSTSEIGLNAATLAALEAISTTISDGGGSITVDDGGSTLTVDGSVALDAGTLAALETINAVVSGTVALDAPTLAALETIELGATTLAALETITVTGTVELGATTLAALESITVVDGGGSLTVDGPLTDAQLRASAVSVEQATSVDVTDGGGSLTVDGPLTDVQLRADPVEVSVTGGGGGLTDTELRAAPVSVEQATSVDVADGGGSLTVDGPLTDAQLAARLPLSVEQATSIDVADGGGSLTVDGTVTANAGSGTMAVSGPLTDAQIRATALPVSGTVTASGPLTDAQLRAAAISVEQATSVAVTQDQPASQTNSLTAVSQARVFAVAGYASASLLVYGTYAGLTLLFEASNDGTNYATVAGRHMNALTLSGAPTPGTNASAMYAFDCVGFTHLRITSLIGPSSGTANLVVQASAAPYVAVGSVFADTELAAAAIPGDAYSVSSMSGPAVRAVLHAFNGTTYDAIRSSITNGLFVDVTRLPVAATSAVTNVSASTSNVTLKASNASRKGLYIQNDGTGILYVKLGATATATTSYSAKLVAGAFWELPGTPLYTGIVDGIWSATGGNGALVTELTA